MLFSKKNEAFLIDTENVGSTWVNLFDQSERRDFYIFVTANAKNLNYSILHEITENKLKHSYKIIDCSTGKNSLDFCLSSYLGYLIGKGTANSYIVVSEDTGYDGMIALWKSEGVDVKRIDTKAHLRQKRFIKKKPEKKETQEPKKKITKEKKKDSEVRVIKKRETPTPKKTKANPKEELLTKTLKNSSNEEIKSVKKILDSVSYNTNNDVYVALVQNLKQEKGLETYNAIKRILRKYYSLSETKKPE